MSYATDAKLCYGFPVIKDGCGAGCPFFNGDIFFGDIEEWWKQEKGFKHTIAINDGSTKEMKDKYYAEEEQWDKANPLPFDLVDHCSSVYCMYILALPGTVLCARRGYPVEVPKQLPDMRKHVKEAKAIRDFCKKYKVSIGKLGWWLCSFQETSC